MSIYKVKKKLAVIAGNYDHSTRPLIRSWADAIKSYIVYADIYARAGTFSDSSLFKMLESSGVVRTIISFVLNCIKWPLKAFNWLFFSNLSLKEKINGWGCYAPLIINKPRVIHLLNSYFYQRYSKVIKQLKSVSITTFHGGDILFRPIVSKEWQENLNKIFSECDYFHFVSNYLRQKAINLGAPQNKTFVIYPGVDVNFFQPDSCKESKPNKELVITTVGRLAWEKGIPYALMAIKSLKDKKIDIQYWIVGDGPDKEQLLFWIKELSIEDKVILFGAKTPCDIKQLLSKSDIYIQPSIYDACPLTILEASAMELPVIASNVGGIPEIIDNSTGILILPNNAQKIEEAILYLISNRDKRIAMGKNGRDRILEQFTIEKMILEWRSFYDHVLSEENTCCNQKE